jgi:hypothetical protein
MTTTDPQRRASARPGGDEEHEATKGSKMALGLRYVTLVAGVVWLGASAWAQDAAPVRAGTPAATHHFQVTQSGRQTTVYWEDAYIGPALTREMEGVRSVIRVVQSIIRRNDVLGGMPAIRTECRGPL